MIRGFVTGVIWGGVVAAAGLAVMSQVAPLPGAATAPQADIAPTIEPVTAPEALPSLPEPEQMPEILQKGPEPDEAPAPEVVEETDGPAVAEVAAPPAADAAPADAMPDTPATASDPVVEALPAPEATAENAAQPSETEAEIPAVAPATPMTDAPAAPSMPEVAAADAPIPSLPSEPQVQPPPAAPAAPLAEVAPPQPDQVPPAAAPQDEALLTPAPEAEAMPVIIAPVEPEEPAGQLQTEGTLQDRVAGVTTNRLPRIGDEPASEAEAPPTPEVLAEGATPLDLFARPFANDEGKPLFALLLIDEGGDPALRAEVAKLPFPVTFVLDPLREDSLTSAMAYRSAGQEVAMLAVGLPAGATAADMEQSFQALDLALPEAVAVVDAMEGGFQDSLDLARQAVPIVADQGRGLVTFDRGLNPADQVARREGVPSAVIFRILDSEGESVPKMRNYLDRAAFKAAQEGAVVVIGRLRPDTVAAILEWTVEGRAASVALAPLSAVLERPANN